MATIGPPQKWFNDHSQAGSEERNAIKLNKRICRATANKKVAGEAALHTAREKTLPKRAHKQRSMASKGMASKMAQEKERQASHLAIALVARHCESKDLNAPNYWNSYAHRTHEQSESKLPKPQASFRVRPCDLPSRYSGYIFFCQAAKMRPLLNCRYRW
jgi:hypothetical protein